MERRSCIMQVPPFLKQEGQALVYNEDNKELLYYLPEEFFQNTKSSIAIIYGEYVSTFGLFNWCTVDKSGKRSEVKPFVFPTLILCKPRSIEKIKDFKITPDSEPLNYRVLHFEKGDEAISQIRVPQSVAYCETFFKIATITSRIPLNIPYDELWKLFIENIRLQGNDYGLHSQLFGIITAELARDKNNIERPYRLSNTKSETDYKLVSVKLLPNYSSPYASLVSEGFDESLMNAIMLSDKEESEIPTSPLEKIITI